MCKMSVQVVVRDVVSLHCWISIIMERVRHRFELAVNAKDLTRDLIFQSSQFDRIFFNNNGELVSNNED